ncbi:MAG: extracellular solute-binding protein, partial [Treponema sp.]|nr:extracellular solute-binding protein [Treponema sp.]
MKKFSTILCMGLMLMAVSSLAAQNKKSKLSVLSFTDEIQLYLDAEGFGYKDTHPDVTVNYVHVPTDQFPGVLDEYLSSGKNVPDVIGLEDAFVRKYVESGYLLPLDDLYKEVKSKMNDYPIKIGTYNGHVYALSWDI